MSLAAVGAPFRLRGCPGHRREPELGAAHQESRCCTLNRGRLNRSLPLDLDILFAAAMGDGEHDANTDQDRDSNQSPRGADALQDTQFPERGQKATH